MISPQEALFRLRDGNRRFVTTVTSPVSHLTRSERVELTGTKAQEPIAIVLGCSDSRVPIELIFDQSIGDLFVIRVAGNVAFPSQIGSIEYATQQFGTNLIVVLGHTQCGAVQVTLQARRNQEKPVSANIQGIIESISAVFDKLPDDDFSMKPAELIRRAGRANVMNSVRQIASKSSIISGLVKNSDLRIVAAEYSVETGVVDFFDGIGIRKRRS